MYGELSLEDIHTGLILYCFALLSNDKILELGYFTSLRRNKVMVSIYFHICVKFGRQKKSQTVLLCWNDCFPKSKPSLANILKRRKDTNKNLMFCLQIKDSTTFIWQNNNIFVLNKYAEPLNWSFKAFSNELKIFFIKLRDNKIWKGINKYFFVTFFRT